MRRTLITCDCCGKEITDTSTPTVEMKVSGYSFPYHISQGEVRSDAAVVDFCKYCLIDAFKKLDDRPELDKEGVNYEQ